ncbi:MAG TPA: hypothetical protein VF192_06870 [Longimicrobiales bacterium]
MVKKIFLVLVVLGGAMMTVPALRAWARPHLEPAFGDVMDWWGAHLRPLVDPALRWSARNELRSVVRSLKEASQIGQPLPNPSEFRAYVTQRHLSGRGGNDPWGTPYYLVVTEDSLIGGSAGPDRERGTADDVLVSIGRR